MAVVSVLIPTLNERNWIGACLQTVTAADEIIVADGGSTDGTLEIAARAGARVIQTPRGRGVQLRAGAALARGDWLLFMHADTRLDPSWREELESVNGAAVGGAFRFALDGPGRRYRWMEAGVAWRCRTLELPYADQGIFVRREVYERVGGMAPLPILEDIDLIQRVRRVGPLALLETRALTSARRWRAAGLVRPSLRNYLCLALCVAGVPPRSIANLFRDRHWGPSGRAAEQTLDNGPKA